jgi:hypothetical protein
MKISMRRRKKKLKTAICRRLCTIFVSSPLSPRASCRFVLIGLLFCIATVFATPLATAGSRKSEKPYALIFGTVWSPENHPVYGVRVRIGRANDKKPRWELISDHNGEFAQRVPAGKADYLVWAEPKGIKSSDTNRLRVGTEVTVHIEYDERADIGLHLR